MPPPPKKPKKERGDNLAVKYPDWEFVEPEQARCPWCHKLIKMTKSSLTGVESHNRTCKVRKAQENGQAEAPIMKDLREMGASACSLKTTLDLIVNAGLPLSIAEGTFFKRFVHSLCPTFVLPSRRALGREIRRRLQDHSQATADELRDILDLSLTIDIWSRSSRSSFISLTGHFVSEGSLRSKLIDFIELTGRHTGENIARHVHDALQASQCLLKVRAFTTDSASSNFRAMTVLKDVLHMGDFVHLGCVAHKLHLCVVNGLGMWASTSLEDLKQSQDSQFDSTNAAGDHPAVLGPDAVDYALQDLIREDDRFLELDENDDDGDDSDLGSADIDGDLDRAWSEGVETDGSRDTKSVSGLLKKLRSHARLLRVSNVAHDLLDESISRSYDGKLKFQVIPRDVVVRWNSTSRLLSWFVKFRDGFGLFQRQCLARPKSDPLRQHMSRYALTPRDEDLTDGLLELLSPFEKVTKTLSGSSYVTISSIRPAIRGLLRKLNVCAGDHRSLSRLSKGLADKFEYYFQYALQPNSITGDICVCSTFLDPKYSSTEFQADGHQSVKSVISYFSIDGATPDDDSDDTESVDSRRALGREIRRRLQDHFQATADELRDILDLSLTIDIWSRSSRSSFISLTGHFVSEGSLRSKRIDFIELTGRHTGENIARHVHDALQASQCLLKVRAFTTDSASSNFRAMTVLKDVLHMGDFVHLGCAAHKLHLCVVNGLGMWASTSLEDLKQSQDSQFDSTNAAGDHPAVLGPDAVDYALQDLIREDDRFLELDENDDDGDDSDLGSADIDGDLDGAWSEGVETDGSRDTKSVSGLVKKLRSHARLLRVSNVAHDLLDESISRSYDGKLKFQVIPRDVVVRWNSTSRLLSWFVKFRDGFGLFQRQCLARPKSDPLRQHMSRYALTPRDEDLTDGLLELLSPFEK
ncbi:hypothetical protein FOL47_001789, partial [Perkinsus chesapeaki]